MIQLQGLPGAPQSGRHHWSALFGGFQLLVLNTARFSICPSIHPAFRQPLRGDPTSNHVSQPGKSPLLFKAIISYWFCSSREPQPIQILLRHRCVDKHPNIQWFTAIIIYSRWLCGSTGSQMLASRLLLSYFLFLEPEA